MDRTKAIEKAKQLVSQMTVEEACSQLRYDAPAVERLGIPAYNWWSEVLHGVARGGVATVFPQAIALAAAFDETMIEETAEIIATETRAKYNAYSKKNDRDIFKGLTVWSPNINIFRDPRWGRGHETYGEDPYLTGEIGKAFVRGLQGDGDILKTAACAKHFAVHSGPEAIRHEFNAEASQKDLYETYLPAFEELVCDAKVESVMGAYNRTNGEPACANKPLMVDLLRGKWGFEGHFVSDCWAIRDFHEHHMVTNSVEESAALAIKMGCDLNCGNTYIYMLKAYEDGLVTEEEIRTAAIRLFTTRYLLGIMGEGSEFDNIPYTVVESKEHLKKSLEAAEKSCVLLKNNGLLPLDKSKIKTLGVVGPNANSRVALLGNYHGTASRYVTVLEGLQDYLGDDVRVLFSEGSHLFKDRVEALGLENDRISEALSVAENSDAVVIVVGLDETLEGEEGDTGNADASGDKASLLLPAGQRKLVTEVLKAGKPTVIVLMSGSSIDLEDGAGADAVLLAWYPGSQGGKAVANILFGEVSPSGKLPVTFYHNDDLNKMPDFTDYSMKGRTYRYVETDPLYPFGYGLTYGDAYVLKATSEKSDNGDTVINVTVKNDGKVATDEVVQVYCQNKDSKNAPKNPRLVAFKRVNIPAGGETSVTLTVLAKQFNVINENGEKVSEGTPVLYVGVGQPDSVTEKLTGHKAVLIS
jgi:beta-glucosidase